MRIFRSEWGKITLTEERKRHIAAFHPEIIAHSKYFDATLLTPEHTARSKHDSNVRIFYRRLPQKKLFLAIVVRLKPNNIGPCGRDRRVIEVLASLVQTRGRDHAVLDL